MADKGLVMARLGSNMEGPPSGQPLQTIFHTLGHRKRKMRKRKMRKEKTVSATTRRETRDASCWSSSSSELSSEQGTEEDGLSTAPLRLRASEKLAAQGFVPTAAPAAGTASLGSSCFYRHLHDS